MEKKSLAVVTGAAHRLGRTLALALAKQGFSIFVHYNSSENDAMQTIAEIESFGVSAYLGKADLGGREGISDLILSLDDILLTTKSRLRVLINSASIMIKNNKKIGNIEDWDATLDINLRAPYLLSTQLAERMNKGGVIINMSDIGARKTWTNYLPYVVSKSALDSLTRLLAKRLAPKIRVNGIAPGLVFRNRDLNLGEWDRLVKRLPLQHAAKPEDIASALLFLLSNESITGQTLAIDSGYSLM